MGETKCENHEEIQWGRLWTWFYRSVIALIIIFGVISLITRLVLNPKNPRFTIQDATLYNFSVSSSPDLFTSVFQVTINSHNPNGKLGLYYKNLNAFATYRDQIVSEFTTIPPTYQGNNDWNIWSPFIKGINIPISPYNVYALNQDQANGVIPITIKIIGNLKWKALSRKWGDYDLHVTCRVLIPVGSQIQDSFAVGKSIKYLLSVNCKVNF
ncbi:hypothetical protein POM88_007158 [Heracleum sosnowskyi]|uniref:Late embryogenesis abundant protein LEA-2 subgroup domain-containing protein n=1 Tax=Heracleum sosnowskyi TaxID=360622 RepID=A0AAD8J3Z8_9APIA|nr:hypothetical protein POM88_007115 [Heracleum sosnowskyi]KAK1397295.1 hypothetical protein POM88_007158 [Heracleum sosnowskyi]